MIHDTNDPLANGKFDFYHRRLPVKFHQSLLMDLSNLPERDRQRVTRLIETKQAQQFFTLYGDIANQCFKDCITDFTSETMGAGEKECIKRCTTKFVRLTNRAGVYMAEKQMTPGTPPSQ